MVTAEIGRKVRGLIRKALDGGWSEKRLTDEIRRLFSDPGLEAEFRQEVLDTARRQFDFMKSTTGLPKEERRELVKIIERAGSDYAKQGGKINRELARVVTKELKKDSTKEDIRKVSERVLGRFRNVGETIAQTALSGFDGVKTFTDAKSGSGKLKYYGPPAERQFCIDKLGNTYTVEQVEKMDNGQGLPVKYYKGGHRCRHRWVEVE